MELQARLSALRQKLPPQVTLVAVSKTKPAADILEAYQAGQRVFGENKTQEMAAKASELPPDIHWHMIGHLQRNKVKNIAAFVSLIHSVDRFELLAEINKQAKRNGRIIPCLLQMRIAREETKHGLSAQQIKDIIFSDDVKQMSHLRISGLMGMATFTDNKAQVAAEFSSLRALMNELSSMELPERCQMDICSMGMSGDWEIGVAHGSNMVRIGSALFGSR